MKFGFTQKCQGCTAINRGILKQPHSEACRSRIEAKLREEGHAGLQRAEDRINDQIAEKIRKKDEGELAQPEAKRVRISEPPQEGGSSSSSSSSSMLSAA